MATMSSLVVFDTSIFIGQLRHGHYQDRIDSLTGLIRISAVVLAKLWRGATKPAERNFLRTLQRNHPIWVPTKQNWGDSGELLGQVREDRGFTPEKLRNL